MADALEKTFSLEIAGERTPDVTINTEVWRRDIENENLPEIKYEDVQEVIRKLPSGKATGEDGIPYEAIKKSHSQPLKR
jgi:hypothetical protein